MRKAPRSVALRSSTVPEPDKLVRGAWQPETIREEDSPQSVALSPDGVESLSYASNFASLSPEQWVVADLFEYMRAAPDRIRVGSGRRARTGARTSEQVRPACWRDLGSPCKPPDGPWACYNGVVTSTADRTTKRTVTVHRLGGPDSDRGATAPAISGYAFGRHAGREGAKVRSVGACHVEQDGQLCLRGRCVRGTGTLA